MFTGIVEERGRVILVGRWQNGGTRIAVLGPKVFHDSGPGDSVAVNGVCLTVVERSAGAMSFDLADETLERTTLGILGAGRHVNLERPVTLATRLGGHLVQGHVDAVATVRAVTPAGSGSELTIEIPDGLAPYIVEKGSIAVDGVSLTVAAVNGDAFTVALIPHTLEATTLGDLRPEDRVNLEADVVAKYLEGLMGRRS